LLSRGVHVVSASKRVIAGHHGRLTGAADSGARLLYAASVGGSAPILETVFSAAAQGRVSEVLCVVNGTVNFILDRLAAGIHPDEALRQARAAGFAEEDCEADLSGADAGAKLRIVAHHAFGIGPETLDVAAESLDADAIARIIASGERWVQVARLERTDGLIDASVRLRPLREAPDLAGAADEWNAAVVSLIDGTQFRCIGRGAGGAATAEAIVADLDDISRHADEAEILRSRIAS
jgi:homoserine dehydrogenase